MKKIPVILLALLSLACSKQEVRSDLLPGPAVVLTPRTVKTFVTDCGTKTNLVGNAVKWAKGDHITVYSADGQSDTYVVPDNLHNSVSLEFSVMVGDGPFYAVACRNLSKFGFNPGTVSLSVNQLPAVTGAFSSADALVASTSGNSFTFTHTHGWLHFLTDKTVSGVHISSSGNCFGAAVANFGEPGSAPEITGAGNQNDTTFVRSRNDYYIPVLPGTYENVRIEYLTDAGNFALDLPDVSITSGISLELGNFDSKMKSSDPVIEEDCYIELVAAPSDWSGRYLIVAYDSDKNPRVVSDWYTGLSTGFAFQTTPTTVTNGRIASNATTNACEFTLEKATASGYENDYVFKFGGTYFEEYDGNYYFRKVSDKSAFSEYAYWSMSMPSPGLVSALNVKQGKRTIVFYETYIGKGEIRSLNPATYPVNLHYFKFTPASNKSDE